MTEETIFAEAIEKSTAAERSAFLDAACAGDAALRQRVEALLQSHAREDFLKTPAIQRAAEVAGGCPIADATEPEVHGDDSESALDFLARSAKTDSLGRLGHYEVQEIIGRGGMGVVLRSLDEKLHRVVAIKVMAAQLATNATARKRFVREAQAQAAVSHDHIVAIHAVEADDKLPYLVMQYIAGMSLQERLDKRGPMQLHEILRIGMQAASGLAAAHAQGLVHRDIKPANILLENGVERVKITDFGLARAATEASLTQSGVVAGTPQYMSPEQAEGKAVDQRTDLFSLGSVLYAMCTGRAPFRASGTMAVLKRVCEESPTPIRDTNPDIPNWLVAVIDKLHAKDPAARYQTAAEVAVLLNQQLAHLQYPSIEPAPLSVPPKPRARRRRVALAVALVCFTGMIALGALLLGVFDSDRTPPGKEPPGNDGPPVAPSALTDKAFVVLGAKDVAERRFDTLAEAVQGASDGDTIEIRGNGPFLTKPVDLQHRALVIRAGAGFRPVIKCPADEPGQNLIRSAGPLVLEGLDLQWLNATGPKPDSGLHSLVATWGPAARVHAANCRFLIPLSDNVGITSVCILSSGGTTQCQLRNCQLMAGGQIAGTTVQVGGAHDRVSLDNCLIQGPLQVNLTDANPRNVLLRNNTIARSVSMRFRLNNKIDSSLGTPTSPPIEIEAAGNILASPATQLTQSAQFLKKEKALNASESEKFLKKLIVWRGTENLFVSPPELVSVFIVGVQSPTGSPFKTLEDWRHFWGTGEVGSQLGQVKFQGGDLFAKSAATPERMMPDDFRLRPDSPGYRAGKDRKDLGADVDLVGPGPAYERWKTMPEYQQWLKETGQK